MASERLLFIFVFFIYIFDHSVSINANKSNTSFIPSREWKKVKDGQVIPAGLHVRVNLNTGEKEAKLLEDDNVKKSLITTSEQSEDDEELENEILKTILENIESDDVISEGVKSQFRPYEELKEDFIKLNMDVKTDIEIMAKLIGSFKNLNSKYSGETDPDNSDWEEDEDILSILMDLEYLVHQFDNAQEFVKLNGFSDVVYECLNSSSSEIRSEALRLFGSATQSNPKVQIAALDSGAIHVLLKILTFDDDVNVRSRSLFALSCLVRRFPAAQYKLIKDGGLTAFAKIFDDRKKEDLIKLQIKIITLIHDLLFERIDTKMNILEEESKNQADSKMETLKEKLYQYENADLEKKLVEQEWCERISDWFVKQNHVEDLNKNSNLRLTLETVNLNSHDVIEKVVDTLYVLSDICKSQFLSNTDFINLLFALNDVYSELALAESKEDDDFNQFYTSLSNVLKMLTDKLTETIEKDEL